MKLWADGKEGSAGAAIRVIVREKVEDINRKVASRGARAVKALRKAEQDVLQGQRSGRVYKKPDTYGTKATKETRELMKDYGHKLRGGQLYRASAPGEAPARRTGNLRLHWSDDVKTSRLNEGGITVTVQLESQEKYAYYLEKGKGVAQRPFVERIKRKAEPEIKKIYSEPYT